MKLSATEFLSAPRKAVTLLGMSGVGKTYISNFLRSWGWAHYSCDYEIANKYLSTSLGVRMKTPDDMAVLSDFIGKPGSPALGGLPFEEFKRRQRLYYEAECRSVDAVPQAMQEQRSGNFVHDSTGSLCEIMDEGILGRLGQRTLFVYLKASPEEEKIVLARAKSFPKPLFFPPAKLEEWVEAYLDREGLAHAEEMDPDGFSRWVFPQLFATRLPKYQRLADLYGVTVESKAMYGIQDERDFLGRIAGALEQAERAA